MMNLQAVLKEIERDYRGTLAAWEDAIARLDFEFANMLREELVALNDHFNELQKPEIHRHLRLVANENF